MSVVTDRLTKLYNRGEIQRRITERIEEKKEALDGEEFVIMLPGATQESAAAFAEELRQGIEKLRFEKCGKISASFGVAQALPAEDPDPLAVRADTALYKAKVSGKNTVCVAMEKDGQ